MLHACIVACIFIKLCSSFTCTFKSSLLNTRYCNKCMYMDCIESYNYKHLFSNNLTNNMVLKCHLKKNPTSMLLTYVIINSELFHTIQIKKISLIRVRHHKKLSHFFGGGLKLGKYVIEIIKPLELFGICLYRNRELRISLQSPRQSRENWNSIHL